MDNTHKSRFIPKQDLQENGDSFCRAVVSARWALAQIYNFYRQEKEAKAKEASSVLEKARESLSHDQPARDFR